MTPALARKFLEHWTERRPAPLDMTDTEILNWENEYVIDSVRMRPTAHHLGGITLYVSGISPTQGETLREAVCLAAAKFNEINI